MERINSDAIITSSPQYSSCAARVLQSSGAVHEEEGDEQEASFVAAVVVVLVALVVVELLVLLLVVVVDGGENARAPTSRSTKAQTMSGWLRLAFTRRYQVRSSSSAGQSRRPCTDTISSMDERKSPSGSHESTATAVRINRRLFCRSTVPSALLPITCEVMSRTLALTAHRRLLCSTRTNSRGGR
jgi:hypothetical protein